MTTLFDTQQVAKQLHVSRRTVENWRLTGEGPVFVKTGRLVRYRQSDIDYWLNNKLRMSTSSPITPEEAGGDI